MIWLKIKQQKQEFLLISDTKTNLARIGYSYWGRSMKGILEP